MRFASYPPALDLDGTERVLISQDDAPRTAAVAQLLAAGSGSRVVDVRAYGAVGDGVTDDSAAVLAALDRIATLAAGTLMFPPGVYRCATSLVRTLGSVALSVRGAGREVSTLLFDGVNGFDLTLPVAGWWFRNPGASVEFSDLSLVQNVDATGCAIRINGQGLTGRPMPVTSLTRITVRGASPGTRAWAQGIVFTDLGQTNIQDCQWFGKANSRTGDFITYLSAASQGPVEHRVVNTSATYANRVIVAADYIEGIHVSSGDWVAVNYGVDWQALATSESHLDFCNMHVSAAINCLKIRNVVESQITGNLFYASGNNAGLAAISLFNAGATAITGNTFRVTNSDGAAVGASIAVLSTGPTNSLTIDGNSLNGTEGGLVLSAGVTRVRFGPGNSFDALVRTQIADAGSNNDIVRLFGSANTLAMQAVDNAATGGNPRGSNSIDLQSVRTAATQVASGPFSFAVGSSNTSAGSYAGAGGVSNTVSGVQSFAYGNGNVVSGAAAAAFGFANAVGGEWGFATGGFATTNGSYGKRVHASGRLASLARAMEGVQVLRASVAGADAVRLTADGAAAGSFNTCNIPALASFCVSIQLVARNVTAAGNSIAWSLPVGLLDRPGAAATTTWAAGTSAIVSAGTGGTSTITVLADTTNGGLAVSFTPPAGNTSTWEVVATIRTAEKN